MLTSPVTIKNYLCDFPPPTTRHFCPVCCPVLPSSPQQSHAVTPKTARVPSFVIQLQQCSQPTKPHFYGRSGSSRSHSLALALRVRHEPLAARYAPSTLSASLSHFKPLTTRILDWVLQRLDGLSPRPLALIWRKREPQAVLDDTLR